MNQDRLQEMLAETRRSFDYSAAELQSARTVRFVLTQTFQYDYVSAVRMLEQRLLAFPPVRHGDQRRVFHRLGLEPEEGSTRWSLDGFGNVVADVAVPWVPGSIRFSIDAIIDRAPTPEPVTLREAAGDGLYREPTELTWADERVATAARLATRGTRSERDSAERLCEWVHRAVRYQKGATTVDTPAAEALAIGAGVCQDHAHVMLAMCRTLGIRCRYVSGHMLGEGFTHAWVEVLLPSATDPNLTVALPFDPCHGRIPDTSYITIAVGRDYADVAPTSGRYIGSAANRLTSSTLLGVTLLS